MSAQHAAITLGSRITRKQLVIGIGVAIVVLLIAASAIAGSNTKATDGVSADLDGANAQIASLEGANADLTSANETLAADNGRLEAQLTDLEAEVGTLKGRIARLRSAVPLPDLVDGTLKTARASIEAKGWTVKVTRVESSQPVGTVLSQSPAAGTVMKFGGLVTLTVAKAIPPPPPAPAPVITTQDPGIGGGGGCHPSYSGACLDPNASDYDCAGGSGDGPKYTGPVQVVGYDEYGLDTDNDGYGCE